MTTPNNEPPAGNWVPATPPASEPTVAWGEATSSIPAGQPAAVPPMQAPPAEAPTSQVPTQTANYGGHTAPTTQGWVPEAPSANYSQGYPQGPLQPGQPVPQQTGPWPGNPTGASTFPSAAIAPQAARVRNTKKPLIAIIAAVIIALILLALFVWPGFAIKKQLNVVSVQKSVEHILSDSKDGYGLGSVQGVTCNGGKNPSAAKGTKFDCDATINGTKRKVPVTVSDDNGGYQVGIPS